MICYEHIKKKTPKCSHLLRATTGTPILPETANNGLDSSKTGREAGKRWVSHARRLVRQTVHTVLYHIHH